ncbi:drug resistance transporter, EmrB/QacA subfamily [Planifilum fulgidum]|uniref:Drug resistance transporter, EmrB/QacA subfamily n=1 Tax=Planifilum fulgidum TaxID=201973 RepID=A0A1I2NZU7_9BACL|nr:drug resistance transporter, EmrB/QacA subfamily [Planifilum fulgidum]
MKEKLPKGMLGTLLILVFGALPPMLDTTIVNIAVNDLAKMFSSGFAVTQWVVTGYTLALGIAVPFSGWLMKKYDGKKVFMGALGLFLAGSLLCGLAWDMESLIFFRVLQGFASGLLIPTVTSLAVQVAGNDYLGRAMSIVGIPVVFAPIIGPVVGGLILQYLSWRWLFFVNLPFGAVALMMMQWKLPRFEALEKSAKLDWLGVFLLVMISGSFIFGVTEVRASGAHALGMSAFAAGTASLIVYVLYAGKKKDLGVDSAGFVQIEKFQRIVSFPVFGGICHQRADAASSVVFSKCARPQRHRVGALADTARTGDAGDTAAHRQNDGPIGSPVCRVALDCRHHHRDASLCLF